MIDEEKFVNELKDCWTGREFKFENTAGSAMLKVLSDDEDVVRSTFQWFNNYGVEIKSAHRVDVDKKEYLKRIIVEVGWTRSK